MAAAAESVAEAMAGAAWEEEAMVAAAKAVATWEEANRKKAAMRRSLSYMLNRGLGRGWGGWRRRFRCTSGYRVENMHCIYIESYSSIVYL